MRKATAITTVSFWQKAIASGVGLVGVENMHAAEEDGAVGEEVGGVLGGFGDGVSKAILQLIRA